MDPGYNPRTVEEVFRDFKGRRAGIIRALTTDVEDFFQQCDPEKENLCLYGFPNENWEVNLPAEEVPPELPEPALGINFARDGMQEKDWLSMVAVHSDAWLLSVAFYFGARFGFDRNDRKRLFGMINELPTTFEVVSGKSKIKAPPSNNNHSNSKSKSNNKTKSSEPKVKQPKPPPPPQVKAEDPAPAEEGPAAEEEEGGGGGVSEGEHGETLCGACGESYGPDEFWICCDICEKWFHGKCVKITAAKAEHIKQYKCPACTGGGGGGGGGGGSETSAAMLFSGGGSFVGGDHHQVAPGGMYNDQAVMLPQMSATALLQKASQMGSNSSAHGGGASVFGGLVGSSVPSAAHGRAPMLDQSQMHLQSLMNSLAAGGMFGGANSGSMIDPRMYDMEQDVKFSQGGRGGAEMTRDFLGVGGGGVVRGMPVARGEHHDGTGDMSSLEAEMKSASSSFTGGRMQ